MRRNYIREKRLSVVIVIWLCVSTPLPRRNEIPEGRSRRSPVKGRKPETRCLHCGKAKKGCCELHEERVLPFRDV